MKILLLSMLLSFINYTSSFCQEYNILSFGKTEIPEIILTKLGALENEQYLNQIRSESGKDDKTPWLPEFPSMKVVAILHDENAFNRTHDIEVRDGIAYLAGKGGSLAVVDVKDPTHPRLLYYVHDPIQFNEAETVMPLSPNRLLIGTLDVLLFDVANPAQLRLLDSLKNKEKFGRINGFARRGDKVFGANKDGYIFAVDVSNPDNINLAGARETRNSGELGYPHDIAFCGDLLVVVSPEEFGNKPGRLAVYRVFDPTSGKLLPSPQWELVSLFVHPRLAGANRMMMHGNLACVGSSLAINSGRDDDHRANVSIVDITNPASPQLRGSLDFPDESGPNGLELSGKIAFAAGGQTVQAIDISNPDKLLQRALLFSPEAFPGGKDDGHDLVLVGDHLFVTAQNSHSLVVISVAPEVAR